MVKEIIEVMEAANDRIFKKRHKRINPSVD